MSLRGVKATKQSRDVRLLHPARKGFAMIGRVDCHASLTMTETIYFCHFGSIS